MFRSRKENTDKSLTYYLSDRECIQSNAHFKYQSHNLTVRIASLVRSNGTDKFKHRILLNGTTSYDP